MNQLCGLPQGLGQTPSYIWLPGWFSNLNCFKGCSQIIHRYRKTIRDQISQNCFAISEIYFSYDKVGINGSYLQVNPFLSNLFGFFCNTFPLWIPSFFCAKDFHIYMLICPYVCVFVCLCVCLSVCLSVCVSVHFWGTVEQSFCPHFQKSDVQNV